MPLKLKFRIIALCILLIVHDALQAHVYDNGYQQAERIKNAMNEQIYHAPQQFLWGNDNHVFSYIKNTRDGRKVMSIDLSSKTRTEVFNESTLANMVSKISKRTIDRAEFKSSALTLIDANTLKIQLNGNTWLSNIRTADLVEVVPSRNEPSADHNPTSLISPDGKWTAVTKNFNVFLKSNRDTTIVHQLSNDGTENDYYSSQVYWSPDSRKLVVYKIKANTPKHLYLIESSPTDQLYPRLHKRNYLRPGDALPETFPVLFSVDTRKQLKTDYAAITQQYRLYNPRWKEDSRVFTFEYHQRGNQLYKVMAMDAFSGTLTTLIKEQSTTFLDQRAKGFRYDLDKENEMIWASERDGWNHLYLHDSNTGQLKNQITQGDWVVRGVAYVDEINRTILFWASGIEKGINPYFIRYYRINFDGTGLQCLTEENGYHEAFFSPDHRYFVDVYSTVDQPPIAVLKNTEHGEVVMEVERADISDLLSTGWKPPESFSAKGRDDSTDIWGIIVRPSHFDPNKAYPVIEYVYTGPHDSFVPHQFIYTPASGDYRTWTALHELAELGFIVVQADGMGTSNRSKVFHDICWKNLKDAGFPDRIKWIKEAASAYPYMDLNRMGIYGNSAGGQSAVRALIDYPDFYKVCVSSSGCHDNRIDKLSWNEHWMGYPVGPQYEESSNVTHAHKLQGKLMLILGEMDTNVDPAATFQLVNALINATIDFDFVFIPGMGHSLGGDYGERKRRDFFIAHLLNNTP